MLATANVTLKYGHYMTVCGLFTPSFITGAYLLDFFFLFTSNCPRLLNEYETCVPVSSLKAKNKSYNYRIVLGKHPYLRMHPRPYFGCSVVWAVLCVTTHHERLKIFNKFMSSWVIFIFD